MKINENKMEEKKLLGKPQSSMILNYCLLLTQHEQQLVKTVEKQLELSPKMSESFVQHPETSAQARQKEGLCETKIKISLLQKQPPEVFYKKECS